MDFKLVLEKLIKAFEKENVQYALIGGLALGLWGVGRATVDIDFLIIHNDIEKVDKIMLKLGYECKYRGKNVSQYVSPLKIFGEVDFLHAFKAISIEMIQRADEEKIFANTLKIRIVKPEDLIGLKFQAIKNNPSRQQRETEDIESLIRIHKNNINWSLIEEYAKILEMEDIYKELRKKNENF